MIETGIVTKQVTLAEGVQINMDFDEVANIINLSTAIKDKGLESLFDEDSIKTLNELIECLHVDAHDYMHEFDCNGYLIEEEDECDE